MELSSLNLHPTKLKQFQKKGINTVEDLLGYIPKKYFDYRHPVLYQDFFEGANVAIEAYVTYISYNEQKKYWKAYAMDEAGDRFEIWWFGNPYGLYEVNAGCKYLFCGKVALMPYNQKLVLTSPMWTDKPEKMKILYPSYSKIAGMSDIFLKTTMEKALNSFIPNELVEPHILDKYGVCYTAEKIVKYHKPLSREDIAEAQKRDVFDELFHLAIEMERNRISTTKTSDVVLKSLNTIKPFMDTLPFPLTDGEGSQLETIRGIIKKINKGYLTTSLVEGDVGTGKTLVAVCLMLAFAENGYQSVLMAPTNVLATQHFNEISRYSEKFDFIKPVLLSGKMKVKEKRTALEKIKSGEANFIVGTHSLISEGVEFNNLGLCIIDEEHRFGVAQRDKIREKITSGVHAVSMSATPIPRTLGKSLYGDETDIYTITKKPNGRKPVETVIVTDKSLGYEKIREEIQKGHQAYIVCPLIEEADNEKMANVESAEETYDYLRSYYSIYPDIKLAMVNGKMKADEVADIINKFARGEYNVIVSTTIIEVGVNVPNATVIMIKNAERFGLAQLHQLRGRVGRGSDQSYCILNSSKEDEARLIVMTETNDGFKIAEEDIKIRGMGDFLGTKQSGEVKNVMLMIANPELYNKIKMDVIEIFKDEKRRRYYYEAGF